MNPPASALLEGPSVDESDAVEPEVVTPPEGPRSRRPKPTYEDVPKRSGGFRRGLWMFVKVVFVLALVAAAGVAAVFGWTELDKRLSEDAVSTGAGFAAVEQQIEGDAARITELEDQVAALTATGATVPSALGELDSRLAALTESQAATETGAADLQDQIDAHTANLETLTDSTAALDATALRIEGQLGAGLDIARSMELISRAQMYLYQSNYGLALDDSVTARSILAQIDPEAAGVDAAVITGTVERLDLAIGALPDRPVLAADDLSIAWRMLLDEPTSVSVRSFPPIPVVVAPAKPVDGSTQAVVADPAAEPEATTEPVDPPAPEG